MKQLPEGLKKVRKIQLIILLVVLTTLFFLLPNGIDVSKIDNSYWNRECTKSIWSRKLGTVLYVPECQGIGTVYKVYLPLGQINLLYRPDWMETPPIEIQIVFRIDWR